MKRMLINATQHEELRVAIVDGQTLYDLDIESPSREQKKSNIYKGRITRVEPSLEAAFVDFGADRHGFLPMKEISPRYYREGTKTNQGRVSIKEALKEGQEVIVQVEKEERGNKGAALTTFVSLAGRYLVLMPNNPKAGGVSRRISGEDRQIIRDALRELDVAEDMGLIVRTAGVGRELEELQWDLDYLHQVWSAVDQAATGRKAPFLIYQEGKLIIRALRDYLRGDVGEILVDDQQTYEDAQEFMQQVMPHNLRKLKHYQDDIPLFSRYQIESQIETAFAREVRLPSGGSLAIDHTEALLSIDINSARATKGADIEETAYHTNLESADEIARQLRIRDLGGLVVIDFIDMSSNKNQREVEERLRQALRQDRARVQIGRISRFGLMEMSRQRLRPSLEESIQEVCPRCAGHGRIRGIESLALSVLRLLEEEVMKEQTGQVVAYVPNDVGNFLLNEKRHAIALIEQRHRVPVMIIINQFLETPNFDIQRIRRSDLRLDSEASYALVSQPSVTSGQELMAEPPKVDQPAVVSVTPAQPAPPSAKAQPVPADGGLVGWLRGLFVGEEKPAPASEKKPQRKKTTHKKKTGQRGAGSRTDSRGEDSRARDSRGGRQSQGKPGQRKKTTPRKTSKKTAKKSSSQRSTRGATQGSTQGATQGPAGEEQRADSAEVVPSRPKRRGRRGGRRRGGQKNKAQETAAQQKTSSDAGTLTETVTPQVDQQQDGQQNKARQTKSERPPQPRRRRSSAGKQQRSDAQPSATDTSAADTSDAKPPARQPESPGNTSESQSLPSKPRTSEPPAGQQAAVNATAGAERTPGGLPKTRGPAAETGQPAPDQVKPAQPPRQVPDDTATRGAAQGAAEGPAPAAAKPPGKPVTQRQPTGNSIETGAKDVDGNR